MYYIYTVNPGDTFFSIANRHNITIADIFMINGLGAGHVLRVGELLILPSLEPQNYYYYQIKSGDTLFSIGRMFDVDPRVIAEVNGIDINDIIRPNQVLLIPRQLEDASLFQMNKMNELSNFQKPMYNNFTDMNNDFYSTSNIYYDK